MIKFTEPLYLQESFESLKSIPKFHPLSGDNYYGNKCEEVNEDLFNCIKCFMTPSCTASLELSALALGLVPGDEIIMPSYTFVSTASAFALRGCKIKFVDIRSDTLNIDESKIEEAITDRTRVIVPVHYAGVPCEMNKIMHLANLYNLFVVEDAAQAIYSSYEDRAAGTFGDFGCFSFHDTKNLNCGEGGALYVNNEEYIKATEIIREKGTNRSEFIRGEVNKYSWQKLGSSYLLSELNSAWLLPQLINVEKIIADRIKIWDYYYYTLSDARFSESIVLPSIPSNVIHNAHIFYIILESFDLRNNLLVFLKKHGVHATSHYEPLHSSAAGKKFGSFVGNDQFTSNMSRRIVRLPLHNNMTFLDVDFVCDLINDYFKH